MLKIYLIFVLLFNLFAGLFGVEYGVEWKKSCKELIDKVQKSPSTKSSAVKNCDAKLKQNLQKLIDLVDEMYFISIADTRKPNAKFSKDNSFFLHSLSEAKHNCEEEGKIGRVEMFVRQFDDDFDALVEEIELYKIEGFACDGVTKEELDELCQQLEEFARLVQVKSGNLGLSSIIADAKEQLEELARKNLKKGSKKQKVIEHNGKILSIDIDELEVSYELDEQIRQILIGMNIEIKQKFYEKEFDRKIQFLSRKASIEDIRAISEIFKQKFQKIRSAYAVLENKTKLAMLHEFAMKMNAHQSNLSSKALKEAFEITEDEILIP